MSVRLLWHIRQIVLEYVFTIFNTTTVFVVVPTVVAVMKYREYGWDIYRHLEHIPKKVPMGLALDILFRHGIYPHVMWLPVTLFADAVLRRYILSVRD